MLYTKYRSQTFETLVGQDVVTRTLKNAVAEKRVGHAYVFSGPRGTGKTSAARILAKAVNCESDKNNGEPCNKCSSCLQITEGRAVDVIEIDAASHTSVDDIRDLIEKVGFSPVNFNKKVYIIDEAHMLSKSAFNALLKTLEEPPSHALFILATTEIHKIPITILSRCQRFDFKLGSDKEISNVLNSIVESEGVQIEDGALKYVIDIAQGSYRDSISTMERVLSKTEIASDKVITAEEVRLFLGIPDDRQFDLFLEFISSGKTQEALDLLNAIVESGKDVKVFSRYFLDFLRKNLVFSLHSDQAYSGTFFLILKEFIEADKNLSLSPIIQLPLEMAIIRLTTDLASGKFVIPDGATDSSVRNPNKVIVKGLVNKKKSIKSRKNSGDTSNHALDEKGSLVDKSQSVVCGVEQIQQRWQEFITAAKPYNGHLYAFISKSRVLSLDKFGVLTLNVPYDFYKERIEDSRSRDILTEVGKSVFGLDLKIKCVVEKEDELSSELNPGDGVVDNALEVFGGDVV